MINKEQVNYETIFILDAMVEDEKLEGIISKYSNFLTKNDCSILKVDKWGRKKFAYPIKKRNSGFYVTMEFAGGPDVIAKLERAYHLDESILRYLTVSYDKKTLLLRNAYFEKRQQEIATREKETAAAVAAQEAAERDNAQEQTPQEPETAAENKV
jgi:small subunit ribosomal protein S6